MSEFSDETKAEHSVRSRNSSPHRVQVTEVEDMGDETPSSASNQRSPGVNTASSASANQGGKGPAPRGQCKFDGTDYPDWLPINPFKKPDEPFTFPFPEVQGDPWAKVSQIVKDSDEGMCSAWVEEVQNTLLLAGLFSAVVTSFAVESQKLLQPDPAVASVLLLAKISSQLGNNDIASTIATPFQNRNSSSQSVRINALIYFSLTLSLGTALVGIITLQWIRSYKQTDHRSHKVYLSSRHARYEGLMTWKVPAIISALPLILQASLIIFFIALIDFLHLLNNTVAIVISLLVVAILSFVLFTMVAPSISMIRTIISFAQASDPSFCSFSAYHSSQSLRLVHIVLFFTKTYYGILSLFKPRDRRLLCNSGRILTLRCLEAADWLQIANIPSRRLLYSQNHQGSMLGWIIKSFINTESVYHIFHCFQTLDIEEMKHALIAINGKDELPLITKFSGSPQSTAPDKIGQEETKHLLSATLIDWVQKYHVLDDHHIHLYQQELLLRSMTYQFPPELPEVCMVPSRLSLWGTVRTMAEPRYDVPLHPELWVFGYLISLQGDGFDPTYDVEDRISIYHWQRQSSSELVRYIFDSTGRAAFDIVDDILGLLNNLLKCRFHLPHEDMSVRETEADNLLREIMDPIFAKQESMEVNTRLMQRPAFLSILEKLASDPRGQELWGDIMKSHSKSEGRLEAWDELLLECFPDSDSKFLTLAHNRDRVKRLARKRNRLAHGHHSRNAVEPDNASDLSEEGVVDADEIKSMSSDPVGPSDAKLDVASIGSSSSNATSDAHPTYDREKKLADVDLGRIEAPSKSLDISVHSSTTKAPPENQSHESLTIIIHPSNNM